MTNSMQDTLLEKPDLLLNQPEQQGLPLSTQIQQALSVLVALCQNERVSLQASPSGMLFTSSPPIQDIVHFTGSGANDTQQGSDTPTTFVACMAHPDNASAVWVRPNKTATVDNAWPLESGEVVGFTMKNLKQLNMLIVGDGEKLIVAYTQ